MALLLNMTQCRPGMTPVTFRPRRVCHAQVVTSATSGRKGCNGTLDTAVGSFGNQERDEENPWQMEIIRNLARRKLRSFLTISGIVIGIFALTTMGAMAEHFNALLDGGAKYFASNIQIGPPDGQQAALLPLSKMSELQQVEGVDAVYPSYSVPLRPG